MDTYRIIMSPEAYSDLDAIYHFIEKTSPQNAADMVAQILDHIDNLAIVPHHNIVGTAKLGAGIAMRTLPIKSYVVYFEVIDIDKVVRIVHIRHGARRRPRGRR